MCIAVTFALQFLTDVDAFRKRVASQSVLSVYVWETVRIGARWAKLFAESVLVPSCGHVGNSPLHSRPDELLNRAIATTVLGPSSEWVDRFTVMGFHGSRQRHLVLLPDTMRALSM